MKKAEEIIGHIIAISIMIGGSMIILACCYRVARFIMGV